MCFFIDQNATSRKSKVAWKVVDLCHNGDLKSEFYSKFYNYPGEDIHRKPGKTSNSWGSNAKSGIYVFGTLKEAEDWCGPYQIILKLKVSPADWLYSSVYGDDHTYDKVTVCENQPYIEWY